MLQHHCSSHKKFKLNFGALRSKEWSDIIRLCIAEFLCTMGLVVIPCAAAIESPDFYIFHLYRFHQALCYGLSYMMTIVIAGHVSGGQCNPSVTICCFIFGLFRIFDVLFYILAQLIGAIFGALVLKIMLPAKIRGNGPALCTPWIPPRSSIIRCLIAELLGTTFFLFVCCAMWDYRNRKWQETAPIKLGLTICGLVLAFGGYSKAHFNPARSMGPAIVNGEMIYLSTLYPRF
ncbi:aquaporin AQPAn.G-like isoform X2 [Agrilus planipennis]|uniref:Aquaporin AQPAn.G-like isoform X2 n=1 Tax=Agrilus planipennis TaxID=224129 RepID=A0A7F5R3N5_AGRPL|nr:aquaporin AQPAn.G-like isoform X2 [Agrilus planipennis]